MNKYKTGLIRRAGALVVGMGFVLATPGHAGIGSSGGGNVVACRGVDTIEVLDAFEARVVQGLTFYPGAGATPVERALAIVQRIPDSDALRRAKYQQWIREFMQETEIPHGVQLSVVTDSNTIALPTGCQLEQLAIQRNYSAPGIMRYLISGDLWDKLDDNGRATLIVHETVYRDAMLRGQTNSENARVFVGLLESNSTGNWSNASSYHALITELGLTKGAEVATVTADEVWDYDDNEKGMQRYTFTKAQGLAADECKRRGYSNVPLYLEGTVEYYGNSGNYMYCKANFDCVGF